MKLAPKLMTLVASAGVLSAGWMLGTANGETLTPGTTTSGTTTSSSTTSKSTGSAPTTSGTKTTSGATSSSTTSPSGAASTGSVSAGAASGTYTGKTATNRYGSVTVSVTLSEGKITDLSAKYSVNEQKSTQFVNRALPTMKARVLAANSAKVATVSGATYTSQSYLTSLQSALDQAK